MSGIAGVLSFAALPEGPQLVRRLIGAMQARGPDAVGQWSSGNIALGHCMLRTTPQSQTETQPAVDLQRGLTLVMDGRIDNRAELFAELKPAFQASVAPDAAFVLAAYARWGEDCPSHLLGDFAFAIWDAAGQKLFCARDPVGAKGLAFVTGQRFFAFASAAEALLSLPGVSGDPNENYIALVLVPAFENLGDRRSWHRDVSVLLEGESMSVAADGKVKLRRYWQPEPVTERQYGSDEACSEHFLEVFGQAVGDRLRGLDACAMMMSGGLDSAAIAAMAQRLLLRAGGTRLHGYSAIDDKPEMCIESRCILSLGAALGLSQHLVRVPSFQGMVGIHDLLDAGWSNAHPVDNSILLPALMALAASRNGQRVLLHGASGDLAMQAPHYYPAQSIRNFRLRQAWRECRAASRNHVFLRGQSPVRILRRSLLRAVAPPAALNLVHAARRRRLASAIDSSLIDPGFAASIHLRERLQEQFAGSRPLRRADERLARFKSSLLMVRSGLSGYGRVAARYGVEVRDPWADRRVLDFFFGLPVRQLVRNGWTKHLVRSSFARELPPEVRWRRDKSHLGWKFALRLMTEMNDKVRDLMLEHLAIIGHYAKIEEVRGLYRRYVAQNDDACRDDVFSVVSLILWLRRL